MQATNFILRRAVAAVALALCSSYAAADTAFTVSLDTATFGASGWLDLQFNPSALGGGAHATATLTNFSSGFDDSVAAEIAGEVSGSLASGYVIGNGDSWNDLFHAVNYGGVLSFTVTFSGDIDPSSNGAQSVFAVSAYAADKATLLGNPTSLYGELASVTWTPAAVAGEEAGVVGISYTNAAAVSAVPEPSSWLMLGIGGLLVAGAARRNSRA